MKPFTIPESLLKPYEPASQEARLYKKWEQSGYFTPERMIEDGLIDAHALPFTIILPPPNVTGVLHMGHAMMLTIQDILIRYKRMQGYRTLWLPGTDHAAIATQSKVEKEIQKKEGKSRYDLGREALLARVHTFAQESHDTIVHQMKSMGASLDWTREAFTLDETRSAAVRTIFTSMYNDGLIYRGHRIVNWDPKGQTTISDDEIVYESRKATLYTFTYSPDIPIAISTTRPETKVGDVAIAVHPDDARYKEYIGKTYTTTFCGVPLTLQVIADKEVDPAFGTGALGVTPAHSMTDWEIADRHNLPRPQVINEYAKMTIGDERLLGKKVTEARESIVQWLTEQGLLQSSETIDQNVATAERTGGIIEPLPKLQWFIDVNKPIAAREGKTLKMLMHDAVQKDGITIIPDYFEKVYFHWIDNLRDWCISRQIWYGHRIPVWYKGEELYVGVEAPEGDGWTQDEDTLDTWFSSGLWTFSTLGWPAQTEDFARYHPTDVLETGYDILPFWVSRMILMTTYALGTIPFKTVYFHGLIRDKNGQKMSKSLGNALDPLEIAATYGADAGRMALIVGSAPGTDSRISEDKIKGYKHFANKLWNITRFVCTTSPEYIQTSIDTFSLLPAEKELYQTWRTTVQEITALLDAYKLHIASEQLYHYIWHTYADVIIEESKQYIATASHGEQESRKKVLVHILREMIITLHPCMPFITEALWEIISPDPTKTSLLMVHPWPTRSTLEY